MAIVSEVTEGVFQIQIDEFNTPGSSGSFMCSTIYFIVDNGKTALIETGPAIVAPVVHDAIQHLGYDLSSLSYIILTHIHMDHAGGAGTLARQFPQLQVLVHPRGAVHLTDISKLVIATRQAFGEGFEEKYGPILSVPEPQVRVVEDGEIIPLGGKELQIIYAPGHSSHQMCIYETKSKGLFSGEALGTSQIESSIVEPVAGFDLDAAIATIDKLNTLELKTIFCAHGGVSWEPARLIDSVRFNTKTCGDIILEAMKSGEKTEQISQRLRAYQIERTTGENRSRDRSLDFIIPWYVAYFKRKGFV